MKVFIIGGPNGAGKSTSINKLMPKLLQCDEYVNADRIAHSLSPFHPESVAIQAGKIALERIKYLVKNKSDFAFETTLSSKTFLKFLKNFKENGYITNIIFFYVDTSDLAIERVSDRVKAGGHDIPKDVIMRRYHRSIYNFINYYIPIVDNWFLYNNSENNLKLIGKKEKNNPVEIFDNVIWTQLLEETKYENS